LEAFGNTLRALAALGWLCLALSCAGSGSVSGRDPIVGGRFAMGTALELTIVSGDPAGARTRLDLEFAEVAELDALMSRYDPESALSRINASNGQLTPELDGRLFEILCLAIELSALTDGSFDVTIGPLVELWTRAAELQRLPSEPELAAARALVGAEKIRRSGGGVALEPGMALDLGGIAKGYALDRMADRLLESGHGDALLSFGQSSVWAMGSPADGSGWRLLLPPPVVGQTARVIELSDLALSISSSLGQSSEIAGRRYGHVIDPGSGEPVSELRRAAVVGPSAILVEALSTALIVLEPERGLALIESQPGVEARLEDAGGELGQTSGWQRLTGSRSQADFGVRKR
jgi:thiamine biosynthesis lipoprotein